MKNPVAHGLSSVSAETDTTSILCSYGVDEMSEYIIFLYRYAEKYRAKIYIKIKKISPILRKEVTPSEKIGKDKI